MAQPEKKQQLADSPGRTYCQSLRLGVEEEPKANRTIPSLVCGSQQGFLTLWGRGACDGLSIATLGADATWMMERPLEAVGYEQKTAEAREKAPKCKVAQLLSWLRTQSSFEHSVVVTGGKQMKAFA